jgi:GntR family transcriptional regulator, transcriptional repressor for pyruvate dehydrogenase complex
MEGVRDRLREVIASGGLEVGARLPSEHELARSFGVSRPVIREALGSLSSLGLVASQNGRGWRVVAVRPSSLGLSLFGRSSIDELSEVRCLLEIPGAGLAAERRTAAQLETLTATVDAHAGCGEPGTWVQQDLAFHVLLAEATGNRVQARLVEDFRELQFQQSLALAQIDGRMKEAELEHRRILVAVRDQRPRQARRAMAEHLECVHRRACR